MIVETILNVVFLLVMGIIRLFPTLPKFDFEFLNGVVRMLSLVDAFVSLRVLGICLVVIITVYNLRVIWSVVMWCIRKLPFVK